MEDPRPGRSLPWFRVDTDFAAHPKTYALCDELQDPNAGMYVIRLWTYTMRYAARGRLADGARTALERACEWRGQPGALFAALTKVGWLAEDGEVHDWAEHQGAAVAKAQKDADRKRDERKRRADGARTARGRRAVGAGNETGRDETKESAPIPSTPRDSDLLCEDFKAATGVAYVWQGAKDGTALARLKASATLEEIRGRWKAGLRVPSDEWASCRTVAQLAMKWNDLAPTATKPDTSIPKLRKL